MYVVKKRREAVGFIYFVVGCKWICMYMYDTSIAD